MNALTITALGKALIAQMIEGTNTATFTKLEASSQEYADDDLRNLKSLTNVQQSVNVSSVSRYDNTIVEVKSAIENRELEDGYYIRTIGLYARDANGDEILFGVANDPNPDYMPRFGGKAICANTYDLFVKVDDADKVEIVVNSAAYATAEQYEQFREEFFRHAETSIASEIGVHGLRYFNRHLEYINENGLWQTIAVAGGVSSTDGTMGNTFAYDADDTALEISYTDPTAEPETGDLGNTFAFDNNETLNIGYVDDGSIAQESKLPIASASRLGGVKIGDSLKIDEDGTLNTIGTANVDEVASAVQNKIFGTDQDLTADDISEINDGTAMGDKTNG